MFRHRLGLTEVSTEDLRKALRYVHRGELQSPLTLPELTRCGLQHCAEDLMGALRSVDTDGIRAVLVCVLAERLAAEQG
ncbi:MAG: hypothetical protein D6798_11470 [Deltaproteobacteria bacterium]|nr:MAG: hypothetical protein D6798_11470 [Deltaproteobacteria bacterium]